MNQDDQEMQKIRAALPRECAAEVAAGIDMPVIEASAGEIVAICRSLKDSPETCFEMLTSVTAVDNLDEELAEDPREERRFELVYHLLSLKRRRRARIRIRVAQDQPVPTVTGVWATADWHERETFDMFGIPFEGHPDLRRLHMPEDYPYHPLRKDFPVEGIDPGQLYWKWFEKRDAE